MWNTRWENYQGVNVLPYAAEAVAMSAHHGQVYGDKSFVDGHLRRVESLAVLCLEYKDIEQLPFVKAVCWLHDVLEDTEVTEAELRESFPGVIVDAVVAITKQKGQSNKAYLEQVMSNKLAHFVKIVDTLCNQNQCRKDGDEARVAYYGKRLKVLAKGWKGFN